MNPKISPAEWEVLNVIWDRQSATTADVYQALSKATGWHLKTVITFLARLAEKGVISAERKGKANVYTARVTREQCVRHESETFLQRVFRGARGPLLAHFCEQGDLSREEISQLKKLLEQCTRKGRKK